MSKRKKNTTKLEDRPEFAVARSMADHILASSEWPDAVVTAFRDLRDEIARWQFDPPRGEVPSVDRDALNFGYLTDPDPQMAAAFRMLTTDHLYIVAFPDGEMLGVIVSADGTPRDYVGKWPIKGVKSRAKGLAYAAIQPMKQRRPKRGMGEARKKKWQEIAKAHDSKRKTQTGTAMDKYSSQPEVSRAIRVFASRSQAEPE